ncbi:putative ABC transport system permease protein [Quadrisphaera granulorum]|uniref:Putative ABC transport system permease protein n=1 Tax=Quadrisphaera granulorum TaxID=317664 RepID=A0A315ZTF8_9ACTN|nr:ABC transporter permease [Quadrisphaera granulorum]PWJ48846.1 putative ABC transport system permease protein [Quadrisphaera granulorum]SZE98328.1 putative ABC transport system permease protein [Quadrisphaera granulorum]
MTSDELVRLLVGVVVLLAVAVVVLRVAGVRVGAAPLTAVLRGGVQLAAIGLVLGGVLDHAPLASAAVLAVMLTTAVWTASRRLASLQGLAAARRAVALACTAGAVVVLGVVFAVGVLPFEARYVVALGGIVLGGTMTSATLAGRHLLAGLIARRDEVEAWLSLGATPRRAVLDVARAAVAESLVPVLDQTRTTGLVTLPGAFIGALLGGASPLDAARFQLIVLAGLIAAGSVVAVLVTTLLGAPRVLPTGTP